MAIDTGMYCLDVGQGSCTVLLDRIAGRTNDYQASIVDVGANGQRLTAWLKHYGVTRIAVAALSHHDADHVRGLGQLAQAYKGKIDTLWILPDRNIPPKSIWLPSQLWVEQGWVRRIRRLEAPAERPPGLGERLVGPPETEFELYCIYPDVFAVENVVRDAPHIGQLGTGPNAVSAVLRVAISASGSGLINETQILIGGDLDYLGWKHLVQTGHDLHAHVFVAPHHGGPGGSTPAFDDKMLAQAVRPSSVLISVGTEKNTGARSFGHPHESLVRAFRTVGANVLCTQVTPQCVASPSTITGGSVLPALASEPTTCPNGVACAGTIGVRLTGLAPPSVMRLADHTAAVVQLESIGHSPICRK